MKLFWIQLGLGFACIAGALAQGGGDPMLDTNYYVVGVADWNGDITVQVLSALDYDQLKKDVALDNRALNHAYQNLKYDWRAQHEKAASKDKPARTPSFPLKQPSPRSLQLHGKFAAVETAEQAKTPIQERETQRRERRDIAREREAKALTDKQRDQREEKAYEEQEWRERLDKEIKNVRMTLEMGFNPSRQAEAAEKGDSSSGRKTVKVRQGARLGEVGGDLVRGGDLVDGGDLKKKR